MSYKREIKSATKKKKKILEIEAKDKISKLHQMALMSSSQSLEGTRNAYEIQKEITPNPVKPVVQTNTKKNIEKRNSDSDAHIKQL